MLNDFDKEIIKPCLWGADLDFLDLISDKLLIIERLLEHGGDRQIDFLLTNFIKKDIIYVINNSMYLSRKTVNYWCEYFALTKETTRCYTKPSLHLWPHS